MINDPSVLSYVILFTLVILPILLAVYTTYRESKEVTSLRDDVTDRYYIDLFYSIYKNAIWEKIQDGVFYTKVVSPYATYIVHVSLFSKDVKVCINPDDPSKPCIEDAYSVGNPEIVEYFKNLHLETKDS